MFLQDRDSYDSVIYPKVIRALVQIIRTRSSITEFTKKEIYEKTEKINSANLRGLLINFYLGTTNAFKDFFGIDELSLDLIDLVRLNIGVLAPSRYPRKRNSFFLHLDKVIQKWLREVYRAWLRHYLDVTISPDEKIISDTLNSVVFASEVLAERSDGGHNPGNLSFRDMREIYEAFNSALRDDGDQLAASTRRYRFGLFLRVIDFGHSFGLLDKVSNGFERHPSLVIANDPSMEEKAHRGIPELVISQLNDQLHTFDGSELKRSFLQEDVRSKMLQTVFCLLRDTGRRPTEICKLRMDCVEVSGESYVLLWDNFKAGRYNRRLPILEPTVNIIHRWTEIRKGLEVPSCAEKYLFPDIDFRRENGHLKAWDFSRAMRAWVNGLAPLHTGTVNPDGAPTVFPKDHVFPYALRHSYAQRHADAGVEVVTLKDLLDHSDIGTTLGYYKISERRKREATEKVLPFVINKNGQQATQTSDGYELKSVAVPYGNCQNPSNVRAGGHGCPARFQCSGCGWFRSDPSYLPALKQAITDLRGKLAELEASDAEPWLLASNREEIAGYEKIIGVLEANLEELSEEQRAELDNATSALQSYRKLKLLPLEVRNAT